MNHKIPIETILSRFPKTRPELPVAFQKIYHEHYQNNRQGGTNASRLANTFEKWMHQKVAADLKNIRGDYETLEIGAGTLNHLAFENLNHPYDIVEPFTELYAHSDNLPLIRQIFADVNAIPTTNHYDRILSIATFEHLSDLPNMMAKVVQLLKPNGIARIAIPSEGGLLWKLAWQLSTGLEFRLKYHLDYGILMKHEHINTWQEINELLHYFFAEVKSYYFGPSANLSLYQFYECKKFQS
jgi:SAM-dependent methyltransferase